MSASSLISRRWCCSYRSLIPSGSRSSPRPRLLDQGRLEAPLQRRVPLDVLAVLVQRRRADRLELAPSQRRLEDVRRVDGALGRARPTSVCSSSMKRTQLPEFLTSSMIFLRRSSNSPILRARHQRADVQRQQALAHQRLGDVARSRSAGPGPRRSPSCRRPARRSGPGLFLVRRERIWMTRSISRARPMAWIELVRSRRGCQVHAELVDDRVLLAWRDSCCE